MRGDEPGATVQRLFLSMLAGLIIAIAPAMAAFAPDANLRVVIIRHAEKPPHGAHLSCRGKDRAEQLAQMLGQRFGRPDAIYVPRVGPGNSSKHARMLETITPFAIQQNLPINSEFAETDVSSVAKQVLGLHGTVLMVWEHSEIAPLAQALGIARPPKWPGDDFDSIWTITFHGGHASLAVGAEMLTPAADCDS
jgi:hypothetical protein